MPNAGFSFDLAPDKAIDFLRAKKVLVDKAGSVERLTSARGKAARIANLSSLDMTQDIYQSLLDAAQQGKPLNTWKKELLGALKQKGWLAAGKVNGEWLIADPKTGEVFGRPWRLNTIYRTNTQAAYAAQRYQVLRDNADHRPYWQYTAVGDNRTRPAHLALNGRVYRYDDPFWHTFFPPNGFNCRCTVLAYDDRGLKRANLNVEDGSEQLIDYDRPLPKGGTEPTRALKLGDNVLTADRGFDRNIGRSSYKPNLDRYAPELAHQFAKREMSGESFKLDYRQFEQEVNAIKQQLGIEGKANATQLVEIRNQLSRDYKFSAGVLSAADRQLLKTETATVWLSDDTLIKQLNSREGQNFEVEEYEHLPDVINQPSKIIQESDTAYQLYKEINGRRYVAVLKVLTHTNELFAQSFRNANERQWKKAFKD